jgi:predicted dehydrogenase
MTLFHLAILGAGSIGLRHARNLQALGQTQLLLVEVDPARAETLRAQGFQVSLDESAAFAPSIDAVLICSPTSAHFQHLAQAIDAGKPFFIEKPLSHTLEGLQALLEQATQKGLIGLVGFNMRFRDGYLRAKAALAEGKIGRPLAARALVGYYLPYYHPTLDYRTRYQAQKALGGGVLLDDIHEIDYLLDLLGDVDEVFAYVRRQSDLELDVEDYVGAMLKHRNGVVTQLQMDFLSRVYRRTLEITGSEGVLTLDHNTGELRLYGPADGQYTVCPQKMSVTVNDMYLELMRHFIACLAGQATPRAGLATGYRALQVAMALAEASQKGVPITL